MLVPPIVWCQWCCHQAQMRRESGNVALLGTKWPAAACIAQASAFCRERCSVDDMLLLTQQPLKLGAASRQEEAPDLHSLALVDRLEPDPAAKHMRVVHAHVNLAAAGAVPSCLNRVHIACWMGD